MLGDDLQNLVRGLEARRQITDAQEPHRRIIALPVRGANPFVPDQLDEATAEESVAVLLSLRWLLIGMLLLQTGIDPPVLGRRLIDHEPYQLFLAQARAWLPAVYDDNQSPIT